MLRPRLAPAPSSRGWTRTESAASRGYGWQWTKQRELVMLRDCGLCQVCAKQGIVALATEVDHIRPKAEGGTDDDANLQAICGPCHKAKTAIEGLRARGVMG